MTDDLFTIDFLRRQVTEQRIGHTSASQLKAALLLALDRWEQARLRHIAEVESLKKAQQQ